MAPEAEAAEIAERALTIRLAQKAEVVSKTYGKGKIIQRKPGSGKIMLPPAK